MVLTEASSCRSVTSTVLRRIALPLWQACAPLPAQWAASNPLSEPQRGLRMRTARASSLLLARVHPWVPGRGLLLATLLAYALPSARPDWLSDLVPFFLPCFAFHALVTVFICSCVTSSLVTLVWGWRSGLLQTPPLIAATWAPYPYCL